MGVSAAPLGSVLGLGHGWKSGRQGRFPGPVHGRHHLGISHSLPGLLDATGLCPIGGRLHQGKERGEHFHEERDGLLYGLRGLLGRGVCRHVRQWQLPYRAFWLLRGGTHLSFSLLCLGMDLGAYLGRLVLPVGFCRNGGHHCLWGHGRKDQVSSLPFL